MRVERRRRSQGFGEYDYDVVLICENEEESEILDSLSEPEIAIENDDGIVGSGVYEVRLSNGYEEHYVLLKSMNRT